MKSCTTLHKNNVTFNIDFFSTSYYHKSFSAIIITSQNLYHSKMTNFLLISTVHGYVPHIERNFNVQRVKSKVGRTKYTERRKLDKKIDFFDIYPKSTSCRNTNGSNHAYIIILSLMKHSIYVFLLYRRHYYSSRYR